VEQTLEIMSRMPLKEKVDFAFENNCDYICIWLYGIYDRYTRYRKDCAIVGEVLNYDQFTKQLAGSEFFVQNRQKRMGEKAECNRKVWVLDYVKLSMRCDVSGFIRESTEG
jgi:hypothetical protein